MTRDLITSYFARFNARDVDGLLDLLDGEVVHEICQGGREVGRDAFRAFLEHMNRCYQEHVYDVVVMCDEAGTRAAAEFLVEGTYLVTDGAHPAARGQTYTLRAGAFFEIVGGRIGRVTTHYNVQEWLRAICP